MNELICEAPAGQLIRYLTGSRFLQYPEERDDFILPANYVAALGRKGDSPTPTSTTPSTLSLGIDKSGETESKAMSTAPKVKPIAPEETEDGTILVDWYDTKDPSNPHNWGELKRSFVAFIICLYTFAVYSGSAIYISSEPFVEATYTISAQKAALPLSLYVLAYGIGPLLFAPLSELPSIGRNPVYAITFIIFVILSIPTALVKSFGGLLALRFLQGFFGSPCLANGGASMQDLYTLINQPYAMTAWVAACFGGPALGPLLSGFAVTSKGWRWSLWEILWLAGPICILMLLFMAETSAPTILHRRAARLRKVTGSSRFKSLSEISQSHLTPYAIAVDALIKPIEISIKDPAVTFTNLYTSFVYAIYYSFFDAFPLVYPPLYGFNLGQLGLVFVCIIVACAIGAVIYVANLYFRLNPKLRANKALELAYEYRLRPALFAVFCLPIGLFIFGWTANSKIPWIVSVIGIVIFSVGNFILLQCLSIYIPRSYPEYAASLFAANDFCRSALAAGAIHFARPLFQNLGIGRGVSVLAGISVLGIPGMYILYFYGGKMRSKSHFAVSAGEKG